MSNNNLRDSIDGDNLYQRMIEEIQDYAIILLDTNGIVRNWNLGAQKIKYYSEVEIVGKHFSTFYFEEDIRNKLPDKLIEQARSTGRAIHEGWRKRKDGSKFWGSITITAIHSEENVVVGYCKVTRDLTDRKISEDSLRDSEERYHQMIAEVQDYAIILLDINGIIQNWNAGAERIKGYRSDEVIGKKFELFYTAEDLNANMPDRLLKYAKEHGKAVQEGWRVRKDGTRFWGTIVITALHNKEGEVIGFSKVTRDLTKQKIAEEKMATYLSELEIQNRDLEQFAYVASHDLQEPLRKIQTFVELIQENYDDKEFTKNYFSKLELSAQRMSDLIKSLLNYSKLSKEHDANSTNSKVDLNVIVREVKEDFELLMKEKNAEIKNSVLPVINGNQIQISQLFSNLISNSLKFTEVHPVITISWSEVDANEIPEPANNISAQRYYKIIFEDNGIGFDEKYKELIFSLFQRLHGKNEYSGTGIGLALCKRIVENHNGYIYASSESGKGAKFIVYLPK